ncbi:MAG: hypothetical protein ABEL51_02045 [Salinibacter sp.]
MAEATGFSRKTVYQVLAFLKRVNLLWTIHYRTGRGQHSLYQLNWMKPNRGSDKKCHPPKNPRSNKTNTAINDPGSSHGDESERQQEQSHHRPPTDAEIDAKLARVENLVRAERAQPAKRLMLMALRWSAWSAGLSRGEQQALLQAAGKIVWPEPLRYAWEAIRELIRAVRSRIWFKELRTWLRWVRETKGKCEALRAYFACLMKRLRARVEAEQEFDGEWADAEVRQQDAGGEDIESAMAVFAMAFEGLYGREPTAEERQRHRDKLRSAGPESGHQHSFVEYPSA